MKHWVLLVFSWMTLVSFAKEYVKVYHENGELKEQGWIKNDKKVGYWHQYHANGTLAAKGKYTEGHRSGYWFHFDASGAKSAEGRYQKNKKTGWWLFYDDKGNINHKCQLQKGIKNGYCLKYRNNDLKSAEKYSHGKKIKEWFSFASFKRENNLADLR